MAFPTSNLPTGSMPWGREVEKQISTLTASVTANEINNTARDNQLAKSYARIDNTVIGLVAADIAIQGAVEEAQAAADEAADAAYAANIALNGLIGLGATGSGYTLNADNINGGTITGITLNTASSPNTRVSLNGSEVQFYNSNIGAGNTKTGYIWGPPIGGMFLGTNGDSHIWMSTGSVEINTSGTQPTAIFANSTTVELKKPVNVDISLDVGTDFTVGGTTELTGAVYAQGIYDATSSSASNVHIQGSANSYRVYRSTATSSRESKRDIRELQFNSDDYIGIKPVIFKYNEGILREEEKDWDIIGFIAEDFEDAGFGDQLITQPESPDEMIQLRYDKMYMFLHKIVAEQQERIKALEARLG